MSKRRRAGLQPCGRRNGPSLGYSCVHGIGTLLAGWTVDSRLRFVSRVCMCVCVCVCVETLSCAGHDAWSMVRAYRDGTGSGICLYFTYLTHSYTHRMTRCVMSHVLKVQCIIHQRKTKLKNAFHRSEIFSFSLVSSLKKRAQRPDYALLVCTHEATRNTTRVLRNLYAI